MSWLSKRRSSQSLNDSVRKDSGKVLHEGWAVKESGSALFGKTNWRRRWFRLVQRGYDYYLEYYRNIKDNIPAGYVKLDVTYRTDYLVKHVYFLTQSQSNHLHGMVDCTRPVELKEKRNCFAVGPIFDDGATRTYYISCVKELEMREWMVVIDAVVQGAPEDAPRRRQTVNSYYATKYKDKIENARSKAQERSILEESNESACTRDMSISCDQCIETDNGDSVMISESLIREEVDDDEIIEDIDEMEEDDSLEEEISSSRGATAITKYKYSTPDSDMTNEQKRSAYCDTSWRLKQWENLCHFADIASWIKPDTKDGITISRCKFGRSGKGFAVIKVEGILRSDPRNVFNFLKLSTKQGGKLDYLFRNEYIIQEVTDEPKATIIYNEFQPPLPQVSIRDVVAMKIWVPQAMSTTDKFGFVMFSVDHPDVPPSEKGYTRISVGSSGIILSLYPGPKNELYTKLTIVGQVATFGAMHKMLKGAYNSGLLKLGLRTTFSLINDQLERYLEITNI